MPAPTPASPAGGGDVDAPPALNMAELNAAPPPSRCFKRSPTLPFEAALRELCKMPKIDTRPDLFEPDDDDVAQLIDTLNRLLPIVKARPAVSAVVAAKQLTDDELRCLIAYKLETPYPLYRWLNAHLMSDRRDGDTVAKVGPLFTLLYRAMEKLPFVTAKASRAVIVGQIPSLRHTFENYVTLWAPGAPANFWGFCSFSTDDKVINSPNFCGGPLDDAIVYTCAALTGVDMEPFKPPNMKAEMEVLPLAPCCFKVIAAVKVGHKLIVTVEQDATIDAAYVVPLRKVAHIDPVAK
jgi:hypothetical protein